MCAVKDPDEKKYKFSAVNEYVKGHFVIGKQVIIKSEIKSEIKAEVVKQEVKKKKKKPDPGKSTQSKKPKSAPACKSSDVTKAKASQKSEQKKKLTKKAVPTAIPTPTIPARKVPAEPKANSSHDSKMKLRTQRKVKAILKRKQPSETRKDQTPSNEAKAK